MPEVGETPRKVVRKKIARKKRTTVSSARRAPTQVISSASASTSKATLIRGGVIAVIVCTSIAGAILIGQSDEGRIDVNAKIAERNQQIQLEAEAAGLNAAQVRQALVSPQVETDGQPNDGFVIADEADIPPPPPSPVPEPVATSSATSSLAAATSTESIDEAAVVADESAASSTPEL